MSNANLSKEELIDLIQYGAEKNNIIQNRLLKINIDLIIKKYKY